MIDRKTARRRDRPGAGKTQRSRSTQGEAGGVQPRLPVERDESADNQADNQSGGAAGSRELGEQAMRDVDRGLVDTGYSPVLEDTYRRLNDPKDVKDEEVADKGGAAGGTPGS